MFNAEWLFFLLQVFTIAKKVDNKVFHSDVGVVANNLPNVVFPTNATVEAFLHLHITLLFFLIPCRGFRIQWNFRIFITSIIRTIKNSLSNIITIHRTFKNIIICIINNVCIHWNLRGFIVGIINCIVLLFMSPPPPQGFIPS